MSDIHALETNLDLKQNLNVYANCKQLDVLHLIFNIFDGGVQADLTNYNVRLKAMKADNVPLIQDTQYKINKNVVTITPNEQLTTTSGATKIELQFINKTTGEKKATFNLILNVVPSTLEVNTTISTATYTLLEELDNKLDQAGDFFGNISEAIETSNTLRNIINESATAKSDLEINILSINNSISELDAKNILAEANINDLDTKNATATNKISELETATTYAEIKKQEIISECEVADDKIVVMQAFADVTKISQEFQQIKQNVSDNTASLSEKAQQTDLDTANDNIDAIALYNATCSYASNVFTLTLANVPTTLPNMYTVRVKMTNDWVDSSTIKIGTKNYTVSNAAFVNGDIVTINFDEVGNKAFFKSGGGGGLTETLPQQVDTFTASVGNGVINLNWSNSNTNYLSGYYIVYKPDAVAPTTLNDGSKLDITNPSATDAKITGVTNDQQYMCRIMPYNSKKQVQTEFKAVSATPSAEIFLKDLPIGAKILGIKDTANNNDLPVILIDKNHSGYPSNSLTLMLENCYTTMAMGATTYPNSSVYSWLNNIFPSALPTFIKNLVLSTSIKCDIGANVATNYTVNYFSLSIFELTNNPNMGAYNASEGVFISYFSSDLFRKSNLAHWSRTPGMGSTGASGNYVTIKIDGSSIGQTYTTATQGVRPVFNITKDNTLKVSPQVDAQGYYHLI